MKNVWNETLDLLKKDSGYSGMFHMMERFNDDVAGEMTDRNGKEIKRTYREYITMSKAACARLQTMGTGDDGKIIGLLYDTCMDWPVLLWGILMSGNIPLLLNPMIDDHTNDAILSEARAESYVAAKPIDGSEKRFIDAALLLGSGPESDTGKTASCEEKWGRYVALCTSGTTGASRIFLYDSQTIANHMLSFDEAKHRNPDMPFIEDKPCKLLSFLPFHHVFGFSVVYLLYSCTGKTLVYLRDKSVNTILGTCRKHGVTHLYCIPLFFNALADGIAKKLGDKDIHRLSFITKDIIKRNTLGTKIRSMITGGGHVPASTLDILNSVGYPLCNGFGMTETGIIAVEQSLEAAQRIKGSIGVPFTLTEWKIVPADEETSGITGSGTASDTGESDVCARGNGISEGDGCARGNGISEGELFIRGGALYSASIIEGSIVPRDTSAWFATGDIIRKTADGLFITGRCKDVIIGANGENLYPEELEDAFGDVDGLGSFCILGIGNGSKYDDIVLVTKADASADKRELLNRILKANDRLSAVSRPVRVYFSQSELPVSGSLKVKRQVIKKEIEAGSWICEVYELYRKSGPEKSEAEKSERYGSESAQEMQSGQGPDAASSDAGTNVVCIYPEDPEFRRILDEVRKAVSEETGTEYDQIGDDDHFINVLGADSLDMYGIFSALGDKYGIDISEEQMMTLENCNKAALLIYNAKKN
ncbi:MAG: AMP-binding protein [Lachnospiraceae bacterium]|nr:AMP-binding protein [Lachnospiraceae bacterium]